MRLKPLVLLNWLIGCSVLDCAVSDDDECEVCVFSFILNYSSNLVCGKGLIMLTDFNSANPINSPICCV